MGQALRDILGREIKVGQIVAYPVRQSSSMRMSHGRVVAIENGRLKVDNQSNVGMRKRPVTVGNIDRVVIAKEVA